MPDQIIETANLQKRLDALDEAKTILHQDIIRFLRKRRAIWEVRFLISVHISANGKTWYLIKSQEVSQESLVVGYNRQTMRDENFLSDLRGRNIYSGGYGWNRDGDSIQKRIDCADQACSYLNWPLDPLGDFKRYNAYLDYLKDKD